MGETMTDYDHIAAAVIFLLIVGGLIWRALDRRIYGADPQAQPHGDIPGPSK
ncbi:hypothetical protein FHT98_0676 [Bosea sp. AK1]|uniref:hypothetical protein n=1 Tax=Bosea sp. AK1 TaxID=2587160 RepID=UPI0011713D81|nr:hypothetical protein [Bosea sp. AK1]TQI72955.1 hypothetical protein FHT98_0676 [Bosea sp. AK1]